MRRADEPIEPGVAAALLAIDATLDGDPVDPEFAELAELALILSSERPLVADDFAAAMDTKVSRRFARPAPPSDGRGRRSRNWLRSTSTLAGIAAACLALVVVLNAIPGGGSSSNTSSFAATSSAAAGAAASEKAAPSVAAGSASSSASGTATAAASSPASAGTATAGGGSGGGGSGVQRSAATHGGAAKTLKTPNPTVGTGSGGSGSSGSQAPTTFGPLGGNRQVVQSAQLQLAAPPTKIDQAAQRVFSIVQAYNGIVASSNVTATGAGHVPVPGPVPVPYPGAYAEFQLSIPSQNMQAALGALSQMPGTKVLSRTDTTQDITGQVGHAGMQLAEARALRRSLLKQLAAATTQQAVDSLKVQLRDADAAIAAALKQLNSLKRQVAYSHVVVTIQGITPAASSSSGGGFTLGKAAHDAGRVLVVAAGVALIVLAVLVPVGLLAALLAWIGFTIRRRRREHALDLV